MENNNIRVKFVEEVIRVNINDPVPITVKIKEGVQGPMGTTGSQGPIGTHGNVGTTGAQGTTGVAGTTDHAQLTNKDYDNSEHTGFQSKLNYIDSYKSYEVNDN